MALSNSADKILRAADADRADIELARLLARGLQEIGERGVFRLRVGDDDEIEQAQRRDRREFLERIERQALEQRHAHRRAVGQHRERMAVGGRSEHGARGGDAARARLVLDHEALAEFLAELVGDDARGDVGDAAGGERQHDTDRTIRIGLRPGRCLASRARSQSPRARPRKSFA